MSATETTIDDLMPTEADLLFEEEVLRNPYSLRIWIRYIEARKDAPSKRRFLLYERALKSLPGSYKVVLLFGVLCFVS
jgi:pre-mRNA-splicing factor SYF1